MHKLGIIGTIIGIVLLVSTTAFAQETENIPIQVLEEDANQNSNYDKISKKVEKNGNVRVIVGLASDFQPEGKFSAIQDKLEQRQKIGNAQDALLQAIPSDGIESSHKFKYIPFMAMTVNKNALENLRDSPLVNSIEEDVAVPFHLSDTTGIMGADPQAFSWGFTGQGQTVAILDTGVETGHEFVSGKVVAEACFSNDFASARTFCPNGQDEQIGTGAAAPCNKNGCYHGTHVAGIAAGKDSPSGNAPSSGVAKGANIIAIQVFSWVPGCGVCSFSSDQIDALEHVLDLHNDSNFNHDISSVNLSLGGGGYTSEASCDAANTSRKTAVDNLRSEGIATIASSGNSGYVNALGAPACISSVVSVGSTTKPSSPETLSGFSNSANFLDLLATGSSIRSSLLSNTYGFLSGTSMSAPHVTGAWAILKQFDPNAGVSQILTALKNTGVPIVDNRQPCSICPTLISKPRIQIDQALLALGFTPTPDNTPPVITILGNNPVTHEGRNPYSDAGATALDNVDGDLTGSIITTNNVIENVVGTYTVDYQVTDSSSNTATASRTVNVVDTTPPVITILGNNPVTHEGGNLYSDAGATAQDDVGGDLTGSIITTNNVNENVVDSYTVDYEVTDANSNTETASRTVNVVDTTLPQTTIDSVIDGNSNIILDGGTTNTGSIEFEFSGTDNVSAPNNLTFECNLDSAGFFSCSSPHSLFGLDDGTHALDIRATDEEGNTESTASFPWIVNTNTVLHLRLDGDLTDSGPNALVASWNGGAGNAGTFVTGRVGDGIDLDDTAKQYVIVGDNANINFDTDSFSVMGWIQFSRDDPPADPRIFNKRGPGGKGWYLKEQNGKMKFLIQDNAGHQISKLYGNILGLTVDGQPLWHHIIFVIDRDDPLPANHELRAYFDGVLQPEMVSLSTLSGTVTNPFPLTIGGAFDNANNNFKGKIDEIQLIRRALSDSDVARIFVDNTQRVHWAFEDNLLDDGPNGLTASFAGGAAADNFVSDGKAGKAFFFEGIEHVERADNNLIDVENKNDNLSISYWAKFVNGDQADNPILFGKRGAGGKGWFVTEQNGKMRIFIQDNAGHSVGRFFAPGIGNGNYHHVAIVFDGTAQEVRYYSDGIQRIDNLGNSAIDISGHTGSLIGNTLNLQIGGTGAASGNFLGNLDEIKFYDRVLTDDEIRHLVKLVPEDFRGL